MERDASWNDISSGRRAREGRSTAHLSWVLRRQPSSAVRGLFLLAGVLIAVSSVAPIAIGQVGSGRDNTGAPASDKAAAKEKPEVAASTKGPEGAPHTAAQPAAREGAGGSSLVTIKSGAGSIQGYLALPKESGPRPAVIVIQEWWGLNDQIKSVADRLAANGYVALAPDLYHGKVTDDPNMAMELLRSLPESRGTNDLTASYAYLRAHRAVGGSPIGSVGFCMGGHFSLLLAMAEPKLAACVICYGRPEPDPAKLKGIGAAILGIYGGADQGIPQDMVEAFRKNLEAAGKSVQIKVFPEAGHGFMNPNNPGHKPEETREAWSLIDAFLAKHLAGK